MPDNTSEELFPEPKKPVTFRDFGDNKAVRKKIFDNVLSAAQSIKPLQNSLHTLSLDNFHYDGPEEYSLARQKDAILKGESLHRRLRGTVELKDNKTGGTLDKRDLTIAHIPYFTDRGTFVLNGIDWTLGHQLRLRPGIYTRVKENGEIESHVNVMPGKGYSHHYILDPETGVFKVHAGQAFMPLLPLLRAYDVKDSELRKEWGPELLARNLPYDSPHIVDKLYSRFVKRSDPKLPIEDKRKALVEAMHSMELDPEVTQRTLGKPHKNITKEAVLDATKKLLAVQRGEQDADDRDDLAYQSVLGPEDLLAERLHKDQKTLRDNFWNVSFKRHLGSLQPGFLSKTINAAIQESGLGLATEEVNSSELLDQQTRVTRLGEGGIKNIDSVPDSSRSVQPSHFGMIDILRTPECFSEDTDVMTKDGWKKWTEVDKNTVFACLINDKLEFHKASDLHVAEYDDILYCAKTPHLNYAVTSNHRLYVKDGRTWKTVYAPIVNNTKNTFRCGGFEPFEGLDGQLSFSDPDANNFYLNRKFGQLVGWLLAQGTLSTEINVFELTITQNSKAEPHNYRQIEEILTSLPFKWYKSGTNKFVIDDVELYGYLAQYLYELTTKQIPPELLNASADTRKALFQVFVDGSSRLDSRGNRSRLCVRSHRLAQDLQLLAFTLGISSKIIKEPGNRQANSVDRYVIYIHIDNERTVMRKAYYTEYYRGKVYCATVPGSLLYVRRGNTTGHWSGNSFKIGVDSRFAYAAKKGDDGRIYAPFRDLKTNQIVYKSPQEVSNQIIAFPGELKGNKPYVAVLHNSKTKYVPRNTVQLESPEMEYGFSPLSNMIPMKSATKGQRVAMGSRFITQALPIQNPEAPLVQSGMPDDINKSFEEHYGEHLGAVKAKQQGRVLSVTPEEIKVKYADGTTQTHELYDNFPYSRKTAIHNTPLVGVGDRFDAGQVLAKSNYTDDNGTMALGVNARIAYIPYKGTNYEDAYTISQSFANRMKSEQIYQHGINHADNVKIGKNTFLGIFPGVFNKDIMKNFDNNGLIKKGTEVKFGDPLILAVKEKEFSASQVHRKRGPTFTNASETWEHHSPGVVTDSVNTRFGNNVVVKTYAGSQVGDKFSTRHGSKGVAGTVVPDEQMPVGEDGKPMELLINPEGVISRTNPSTIIETSLAKAAEKRGYPYKVQDFKNIPDLSEYAANELRKYNIKDTETLTDPETGRKIPNVLTGKQFVMKLHHTAESKSIGRGLGSYSQDEVPAKGGPEGSKRVALMSTNALLSAGATAVLKDAHVVRGQKNDPYWSAFQAGFTPPKPKVPLVYDKFINFLKGSGINVVRQGTQMHLMAMTNKDVEQLAGSRVIKNAETVNWKEGEKAIAGGLFDPKLFGGNYGHDGQNWASLDLHEPMPNPVMEEPIRRLLGLTAQQFEDVLIGNADINGNKGPEAIYNELKKINVPKAIEQARTEMKGSKKTARDAAIRKLGYLKGLETTGLHPTDWFLKKVPVIPPIFRPVSTMAANQGQLISDSNYLYKELFDANENLKNVKGKLSDISHERKTLYDSFKAVTGLGEPTQPKLRDKQVSGLLAHVFGSSPKYSQIQQKLLGANVDIVGRATITPNPDLDMDHVGLPEERAWTLYKPFIIRHLRKSGVGGIDAANAVKNRSPMARNALIEEVKERPVIIDRAPVLHRYGVMAFWPTIVKGDTLQLPPIVTKGFGADFDGDAMQFHVPVSADAVEEAAVKLLPSRNLFAASTFKTHYQPQQEYLGGLFAASTYNEKSKRPRVFRNKKDAQAAYKRGEIGIGHPIEILES